MSEETRVLHPARSLLFDLLGSVELQGVPFLEVIEVIKTDATLITGGYFANVVLEALERVNGAVEDDCTASQHAHMRVARTLALGHHKARGLLVLRQPEDRTHLGVALGDILELGVKQTLHSLLHVVRQLVDDVVEPDLLFISNARLEVLTTKNVQGAPNLVVEIGSPSTRQRDETIKRKLYERFGVEEYWVIDPEIETVAVYRRDGESYQRVLELAVERNDTLITPLLPGLQAPLARIFKD